MIFLLLKFQRKMSGQIFTPDLYNIQPIDSTNWEDLENCSLPFPLQFPDTPLEDEADLLPILELDPELELNLDQSCDVSPENLVDDIVTRLEISDELSRLHVMVCGFCQSVFHYVDQARKLSQFLSHI